MRSLPRSAISRSPGSGPPNPAAGPAVAAVVLFAGGSFGAAAGWKDSDSTALVGLAPVLPPTMLYEKRDRIAIVTINRPEAMNAFTAEMLRGMDAAFADFNADPDLWVAILTAAGEKSFCAGMDLKEAIPAG